MADARQNTIVGLFALVGLAVLAVLVFMFGAGQDLLTDTYDINVYFPKGVVGVQEGQSVTLHGKRIGQTKAVEFWQDQDGIVRPEQGVNVIVAVYADLSLPASCKVVVLTSIMGFGRPSIGIVVERPRDLERLARDGTAVIAGEMVPILDQLLPVEMQRTLQDATRDIGNLAATLTPVGISLARLIEVRDVHRVDLHEVTANLDTVIQRFDGTLRNLNAVLGDKQSQADLKHLLANLRQMSESGPELMQGLTEFSDEGRQFLKNADGLVCRLTTIAEHVSTVLQRVDQSLVLLAEGQGSAALFLRDNRFYEELVLTARRLAKTLDDLREVIEMAKQGTLRLNLWG